MFFSCLAFFVFCVFPVHAVPRDSTAFLSNSLDREFVSSETQQQETGQSEENPLMLRSEDVNWDMSEDEALQHFLNQHNLDVDDVTHVRLEGFDGMVPSFIFRLTSLEYLDLSRNQLAQLPSSISDLKNLEELNLSNNKLKFLPEGLFDLIEIHSLHLFNNQLCELSERIANLKNLNFLSLSSNPWKKLPEAIKTLPIEELKLAHLSEEQRTRRPD
jgi:Leucine-rich repeat (LRR) protein